VNHLGVKAIAKRAVKDTGKALVEDYSGRMIPSDPPPSKPGSSGEKAGFSGASGQAGAARTSGLPGPVVSRKPEEDWVMEGDDRMEVDSQGRMVYKNEKGGKK
jgi:hypothetical protein